MVSQTPDAFSKLPDELLKEIAEVLYAKEQLNSPECVRFTVTWVLSLVNRRWRNVVLPILFRRLEIKHPEQILKSLSGFSSLGSWQHIAYAVRSICIWPAYLQPKTKFDSTFIPLPQSDIILPFTNLREFECRIPLFEHPPLEALSHCSKLRSLTLIYEDKWPDTLLNNLPELQTLRLYSYTPRLHPLHPVVKAIDPQPSSYASITTLSLYAHGITSTMVDQCLTEQRFPQLRVLAIGGRKVELDRVFRFVHQHSTILEVNADFHRNFPTCVEAVLSLIHGTDDWSTPHHSPLLDEIRWTRSNKTSIHRWASPNTLVPGAEVGCFSFAFARTALDTCTPTQDPQLGFLQHQRYKCTALALCKLHVYHPDDEDPLDVCAVLRQLPVAFPYVEELRLQINNYTRLLDYTYFESNISDSLRQLQYLRKFTFHWAPREAYEAPLGGTVDDKAGAMEKWEVDNAAFAGRIARHIADICPKLENLVWYMSDSVTFPDYKFPDGVIFWDWKIRRRESTQKPTSVRGVLKYRNRAHDTPPLPRFYSLVGQELEYALKHGYLFDFLW